MTDHTASQNRPFTPASFNQYLSEKKLMGSRCTSCGQVTLPPRAICPSCHSDQMEWVEFSGQGKLAAFTAIYIGPTAMNKRGFGRDNPYVSGIVQLVEGPKISARITGVDAKNPETIQVGMPLTVAYLETVEGEIPKTELAFEAKE